MLQVTTKDPIGSSQSILTAFSTLTFSSASKKFGEKINVTFYLDNSLWYLIMVS